MSVYDTCCFIVLQAITQNAGVLFINNKNTPSYTFYPYIVYLHLHKVCPFLRFFVASLSFISFAQKTGWKTTIANVGKPAAESNFLSKRASLVKDSWRARRQCNINSKTERPSLINPHTARCCEMLGCCQTTTWGTHLTGYLKRQFQRIRYIKHCMSN